MNLFFSGGGDRTEDELGVTVTHSLFNLDEDDVTGLPWLEHEGCWCHS